jgi:hypothetical protein
LPVKPALSFAVGVESGPVPVWLLMPGVPGAESRATPSVNFSPPGAVSTLSFQSGAGSSGSKEELKEPDSPGAYSCWGGLADAAPCAVTTSSADTRSAAQALPDVPRELCGRLCRT